MCALCVFVGRRVRHIISFFRSNSMEVSTNFHERFHGNKLVSMAANALPRKLPWKSVKVDSVPWKFPWKFVEADLFPCKLVEASMEIHGSFYRGWKWKLPLLQSIAASTNMFCGSFP